MHPMHPTIDYELAKALIASRSAPVRPASPSPSP